jgi:hypothetical protein
MKVAGKIMTPAYEFIPLSPSLLFIRWRYAPDNQQGFQFVTDLRRYLDAADNKVYTLADLSAGFISDMATIARLSSLSQHPNHGGGVTFGGDYRADMYVGLYERMAHPVDRHDWHPSLTTALAELERRFPGVTAGVDESLIREDAST